LLIGVYDFNINTKQNKLFFISKKFKNYYLNVLFFFSRKFKQFSYLNTYNLDFDYLYLFSFLQKKILFNLKSQILLNNNKFNNSLFSNIPGNLFKYNFKFKYNYIYFFKIRLSFLLFKFKNYWNRFLLYFLLFISKDSIFLFKWDNNIFLQNSYFQIILNYYNKIYLEN